MKALFTMLCAVLSAVPAFADIDWLGTHPAQQQSGREIEKAAGQLSETIRGPISRTIDFATGLAGDTIQAVGSNLPGPAMVVGEAGGSILKNSGREVGRAIYPEGYWHDDVRNYGNYGARSVGEMAYNTYRTLPQAQPNLAWQDFNHASWASQGRIIPGTSIYPMVARARSRAIIAGSRTVNSALESLIFNSSLIADRLAQYGAYLSIETIESIIRAGQTSDRIAQAIAYQLSLSGAMVQVQTIQVLVNESCSYVPVAPTYYNGFNNYLGQVVIIVVDGGSCRMLLNDQVLSTIDYPRFP